MVEKCKEVLSEDSRYWSDAMKEKLSMAPHWSAEGWIDVLSNGGGQKKRFQYCLKPNYREKLMCLRAIQGHPGKAYSGNAKTMCLYQRFYQVRLSRRKRKGIEINSA